MPRTTTDDDELVATFPRGNGQGHHGQGTCRRYGSCKGNVPVGKISAHITTAQTFDAATGKYTRDDRSSESTLGNLVGDALLDALKAEQTGGAEIGVVNPGGLRAELLYKNDGFEDGVVTYANADERRAAIP